MREEYRKLANSFMLRAAIALLTIIAASIALPKNEGAFRIIFFIFISFSLAIGAYATFTVNDDDKNFMHALVVLVPIEALIIVTRSTYLLSMIWALLLIVIDASAACFAKPLFRNISANRNVKIQSEFDGNHQESYGYDNLRGDFDGYDDELTSESDESELEEYEENSVELAPLEDLEENDEADTDESVELEPLKKDTKLKMSDILGSKYVDSFNKKEQD